MKNSKLVNCFIGLDLWIALSIISTLLINMFIKEDQLLMITLSFLSALVFAFFCSIFVIFLNLGLLKKPLRK